MPAIITHHLFGEDAATLLPENVLTGQEDLLAFLLGNQGPDPLWARFTTFPAAAKACHMLATRMHQGHVVDALLAMRDSVRHLPEENKTVGRAFVLGMAAHYLLDSMTHPLVYALQGMLIEQDPTLAGAADEVHAIIEADIDSWTLWQKRQATVLDTPCTSALACTERINLVASALISQMAGEVFGLTINATEYGRAVGDYKRMYQHIDPPSKRIAGLLVKVELLARPQSRLRAQAHRVLNSDKSIIANLEHRPWRNPSTGELSMASFPDLFHDALLAWSAFAQRVVEGDRARLDAMVANINYYGAYAE